MSELIATLDAWNLPDDRARVAAWAQAYGIDPSDVYRIELRYDGGLVARVHEYALDVDGRRYCPRQHTHLIDASDGGCEIARREPYDVTIISTAGVQAIRDRMQALVEVAANACAALAPVVVLIRLQRTAMRTSYDRRRRARIRRSR